jgi:hypothetical protein
MESRGVGSYNYHLSVELVIPLFTNKWCKYIGYSKMTDEKAEISYAGSTLSAQDRLDKAESCTSSINEKSDEIPNRQHYITGSKEEVENMFVAVRIHNEATENWPSPKIIDYVKVFFIITRQFIKDAGKTAKDKLKAAIMFQKREQWKLFEEYTHMEYPDQVFECLVLSREQMELDYGITFAILIGEQQEHAIDAFYDWYWKCLVQELNFEFTGSHGLTPSTRQENEAWTYLRDACTLLLRQNKIIKCNAQKYGTNYIWPQFLDDFPMEPMSGLAPYSYSDLQKNHFRLLKISNNAETPFLLELHDFELTTAPPFTAFSYVEDDEQNPIYVTVNNQSLPITKNLYDTLSTFYDETGSNTDEYIWAEGLCIDQQNENEKADQVGLISNIFRQAAIVYAFLGHPKTQLTFSEQKSLTMLVSEILYFLSIHTNAGMTTMNWSRGESPAMPENLVPSRSNPSWNFLLDMFVAKWWTRAWTVQNVLCCELVTTIFGNIAMGSEVVLLLREYLIFFAESSLLPQRTGQKVVGETQDSFKWWLNRAIRKRLEWSDILREPFVGSLSKANPQTQLLIALDVINKQDCKHPKDKVYAALSIVIPSVLEQFTIDYSASMPIKTILLEVVNFCLNDDQANRKLDFLSAAPDSFYHTKHKPPGWERSYPELFERNIKTGFYATNGLRTWLPDWTGRLQERSYQFAASRRESLSMPLRFQEEKFYPRIRESNYLILHGWKVDEVAEKSSTTDDTITESLANDFDRTIILAPYSEVITNSISRRNVPHQTPGADQYDLKNEDVVLELCITGLRQLLPKSLWCVAETRTSNIAILPVSAKCGDYICSFLGGSVYYIIRPEPDVAAFTFIGEAYLFGKMEDIFGEEDPTKFVLI